MEDIPTWKEIGTLVFLALNLTLLGLLWVQRWLDRARVGQKAEHRLADRSMKGQADGNRRAKTPLSTEKEVDDVASALEREGVSLADWAKALGLQEEDLRRSFES